MTTYFEPLGDDNYRPTEHAGGAWNPGEIHFSPLGGLIVHAIDLHRAEQERERATGDHTGDSTGDHSGDDTRHGIRTTNHAPDTKQLGRISFDILGFLAADVCTVSVRTVRPGRTIELVEATVVIGGRPAVLARAWFVTSSDTARVEGGLPDPLPGADTISPEILSHVWSGGFVASLDVRPVAPPTPGRGTVWLGSEVPLLEGHAVSPHAAFVALVDTANGIAAREPITEWTFPNVDLTVHFYRQPRGHWVGLDTTVTFGPAGHGLTSTVLHDEHGPVGRAEQLLTVRSLG